MNEDYFDLDRDLLQRFVVSCINENDPTRAGHDVGENPWLRPLCQQLDNMDEIRTIAANAATLEKATGHPGAPIDITVGITPPAPPKSTPLSTMPPSTTPSGAKNSPTLDQIRFAQVALLTEGYRVVGTADGRMGTRTRSGLLQYQTAKHLLTTGQLDSATLTSLMIDVEAGLH
jgi:hypothetical protein